MKPGVSRFLLSVAIAMALAVPLAAATYFGAHVTALSPWINRIDVYNNDDAPHTFTLTIWNTSGQLVSSAQYPVGAHAAARVVLPADPGYSPAPGEIVLAPVEGTCAVTAANERVRPKLSYRYGDSLSLCEFFMQDTMAWEYVLPNTIQAHFIGTGIAVMNPSEVSLAVRLEAFRLGTLVGDSGEVAIAPHTKLVSISEGLWPGVGVDDFDMVRISSDQVVFPTPMCITWDQLNDRHVFFNAAPTAMPTVFQPGDLYAVDSIVGDLMYVPAGTFTQGSPTDEVCGGLDFEKQFTHTLTRNLAVMATEVTQGMWAALKAAQPTLPSDPSSYNGSDRPVEHETWFEAVLFANLLSVEQGLTRCYYTDAGFTTPVSAANYTTGPFYCDFDADGYRLLTEGEWEYCCRAGTATPFWIDEPYLATENCDLCGVTGVLQNLESAAVFCANDPGATAAVATKLPNPWGLYDTHGNVYEWCWDWAATYPTGSATDYQGPGTGSERVIRGGSWANTASTIRSAFRLGMGGPEFRGSRGVRLARGL